MLNDKFEKNIFRFILGLMQFMGLVAIFGGIIEKTPDMSLIALLVSAVLFPFTYYVFNVEKISYKKDLKRLEKAKENAFKVMGTLKEFNVTSTYSHSLENYIYTNYIYFDWVDPKDNSLHSSSLVIPLWQRQLLEENNIKTFDVYVKNNNHDECFIDFTYLYSYIIKDFETYKKL